MMIEYIKFNLSNIVDNNYDKINKIYKVEYLSDKSHKIFLIFKNKRYFSENDVVIDLDIRIMDSNNDYKSSFEDINLISYKNKSFYYESLLNNSVKKKLIFQSLKDNSVAIIIKESNNKLEYSTLNVEKIKLGSSDNYLYIKKDEKNQDVLMWGNNIINIKKYNKSIKQISEYSTGKTNNIIYNKNENHMDLYKPKKNKKELTAIIYCHSGYFINGTEENENIDYYASKFNENGYSFFSINYRLQKLEEGVDLSNVFDLNKSLNYYKAVTQASINLFEALDYIRNMGIKNVILMGYSAGAIMSLVSLIDTSNYFEFKNNHRDFIRGAISIAGTLNSYSFPGVPNNNKLNVTQFIDKKSPPVLLWHGSNDFIVPVDGPNKIYNRYKNINRKDDCKLYIIKNADHSNVIYSKYKKKGIFYYIDKFLNSLKLY